MDFFIRQGSTEPKLKMKLIDDGKNDKSSFNEMLENSSILFEMYDIETSSPIILNGVCSITNKIQKFNNIIDEYYIVYSFTEEQTSEVGKFEGKFIIKFLDNEQNVTSKLIVPIREKLYINII